jgi:hypothetical protein
VLDCFSFFAYLELKSYVDHLSLIRLQA